MEGDWGDDLDHKMGQKIAGHMDTAHWDIVEMDGRMGFNNKITLIDKFADIVDVNLDGNRMEIKLTKMVA
jgi:hypothetical protein